MNEPFRDSQSLHAAIPPDQEHGENTNDGEIAVADNKLPSTARAPRGSWHHTRLNCPRCAKAYVKRAPREGLKEMVLSSVYVYPFECRSCGHRFRMLEWGTRYHRTRREEYGD